TNGSWVRSGRRRRALGGEWPEEIVARAAAARTTARAAAALLRLRRLLPRPIKGFVQRFGRVAGAGVLEPDGFVIALPSSGMREQANQFMRRRQRYRIVA